MLVLSRKKDEVIILRIPGRQDIKVVVTRIDGRNKVRLGIVADQEVSIIRAELEETSD